MSGPTFPDALLQPEHRYTMEPQFVNGQTVWVHSQERLNVGEIGIFLYEGQAYCKKYMEQGGPGLRTL